MLEQGIKSGKLAHAYLFVGPARIGKFKVARLFANILQCPNNFCEKCPVCLQSQANAYLDTTVVNTLYIEGQNEDLVEISHRTNIDQSHRMEKPTAKTDQITVKDMEVVLARLSKTATSNYKICCIKNIERMTKGAANAILKALEEPSGNTVFIFTANDLTQILPTIISRMRIINFHNLSEEELEVELIKKGFYTANDKEKLHSAIFLGQGRPGEILRLLRNEEVWEKYKRLFGQIEKFFDEPFLTHKFKIAEELSKNKEEASLFLEFMLYLLRDKMKKSQSVAAQKELKDLIKKTVESQHLVSINVNARLLLEDLALASLPK